MPEGAALPDVDVLLALTNPAHQHHDRAHSWFAGTRWFATTPLAETALVRLLMNRTVTGQDVSAGQALDILRGVRADDRATFLPDDTSLSTTGVDLIGLAGHRQVIDLHLVGLAARHDCVLVTLDRRIPGALAEADRHLVTVL
ncbi:TA system VapC family ribonuclease toxin [Klenkia sp. PcliD-1-E]|uniref:TA system VapC family ribonuclease toxin n=1 Tax=Klenkia sp. PcliD-1-E TaxID=2954492 RepID=UPI002097DDB3|nr:TA system VapC family ribonuclease toxin [Klenkia sp. PcliD-1-E]MCO7219134.1 hypothetical protein [Klenkia sp. PcliD-1-E]